MDTWLGFVSESLVWRIWHTMTADRDELGSAPQALTHNHPSAVVPPPSPQPPTPYDHRT